MRLIEFGRYAAGDRVWRGEGKPETFDFLGFTHICGTMRGWPTIPAQAQDEAQTGDTPEDRG
jgi:hypothetical protein